MARSALPRAWEGARVAVLSPTPTHPQDFGNRKRIFRVCSRYAEEGALVTFIHYPAELEWRAQIPRRAERVISRAWSQYFTIAPTRPLHEDPRGRYHTIDEWWDPAIGEFLMWLFSVESYDIFIVNYSWLSKALQFAPRSTFKISTPTTSSPAVARCWNRSACIRSSSIRPRPRSGSRSTARIWSGRSSARRRRSLRA